MIFQIAGLPRSGTAWIASVLNLCPDIMCVHEPIDKNVHSPESSHLHQGQSGSHLLVPSLSDMKSDVRIYIDRCPEESYNSLESMGLGSSVELFDSHMVDPSKRYMDLADIVIEFDTLFTEDSVRTIWQCISDECFLRDKVLCMLNMNIQRESLDYDFTDKFIDQVFEFNKKKEER